MKPATRTAPADGLLTSSGQTEPVWTAHFVGAALPPDAIVLEMQNGTPIVLARLALHDDRMHPAIAIDGLATTPFKGGTEKSAHFEVASGGKAGWLALSDWAQATPITRQSESEVFLCRAQVRIGTAPVGWVYGKAYSHGTHAKCAYVDFQGREIELTEGFELLSITSAN